MKHQQISQQEPGGPADPNTGEVTVVEVRFEHLRERLGISVARPRISWIVNTERQC